MRIKVLLSKIKAYSRPDPNAPKLTNKQLAEKFDRENKEEKRAIKLLHGKAKMRAWLKWFFLMPIKWCWVNFRDWRIVLIFLVWCIVLSSEVWVSYLMALITLGTEASKWWLGIANACWVWWLIPDPFSQFMLYAIVLTISTKALMAKIKRKKK
jgi:hypothetical protein